MSTFEMLFNHDKGLLEIPEMEFGRTPLLHSIHYSRVDMVRFLLDRGASVFATDSTGGTALMHAASKLEGNLDILRRILAAGVDVEAHNQYQQTALHFAAGSGKIDVVRELILEHNANLFAADEDGVTPLDWAHRAGRSVVVAFLVEVFCNKMLQKNGQLALHNILCAAKYTFVEPYFFRPPQNVVRLCSPLGRLTHTIFRSVVHSFDIALIHHRDDKGRLPIHIACQTKAPVEFLSILVELDPATLYIADHGTGSLPIHWLLSYGNTLPEYDSVRYLVEQQPGGVGTLAARNNRGALPLHAAVACRVRSGSGGSATTSRSSRAGDPLVLLRTVQYLIQSFPGSVSTRTNDGEYPFLVAACSKSSASLNVVFELVRANPRLLKVQKAK